MRLTTLALFTLLAWTTPARGQTIWHVDDDALPGGGGLSWGDAFDSLESALEQAASGDEVWVARGTYTPTDEGNPGVPTSASFRVSTNLTIYGGFDGTETALADRAGLFDETILTGELGAPGDPTDNAHHVVRVGSSAFGIVATLDGFVVERGHVTGTGQRGAGIFVTGLPSGGVYTTLILANVEVRDCTATQGGGIGLINGSTLWMSQCRLVRNHAATHGGGLYAASSRVRAQGCVWKQNSANVGGALFVRDSGGFFDVECASSLFHRNYAMTGGAATVFAKKVGNVGTIVGKATFRNCTFGLNYASVEGGALVAKVDGNVTADLELTGCIVWRNGAPLGPEVSGPAEVRWSTVRGGFPGQGNLALNPRVVDAAAGDFRLQLSSPCIDAGSNPEAALDALDLDDDGDKLEPAPFDLAGAPRFRDEPLVPDAGVGPQPVIDIGCYEF